MYFYCLSMYSSYIVVFLFNTVIYIFLLFSMYSSYIVVFLFNTVIYVFLLFVYVFFLYCCILV